MRGGVGFIGMRWALRFDFLKFDYTFYLFKGRRGKTDGFCFCCVLLDVLKGKTGQNGLFVVLVCCFLDETRKGAPYFGASV